MSGFATDESDLLRRLTAHTDGNRELFFNHKLDRVGGAAPNTALAANSGVSYWMVDGNPSPGAAPGTTPRNPTRSTAGALGQANAVSGRTRYLTYADVSAYQTTANYGYYILADRLADVSGLSGTSTSLQTISGGGLTLSRSTDGYGVEVWLELYVALGATTVTATVNYTDTANASKSVSLDISGGSGGNLTRLRFPQSIHRVPITGPGVKSVQSIQLSASTTSAGDLGVTLVKPLVYMPFHNTTVSKAPLIHDPVPIEDNACLFYIAKLNSGQISSKMESVLSFVDGPA